MTLFSKHWLLVPVAMALSACSMFEFESEQTSRLCADDNGNFYTCTDMRIDKGEIKQHSSSFKTDLHFVQLSEYTQQIAFDLKNDMSILELNGSIIVTPFVSNNGLIEEADSLGLDLADYLSNDLRDIGVPTSEQSLAGYLYRTENGYIEFSSEQHDALSDLNASYILTGHIRKTNGGLMLSTKIIELKNGKLIASSTKLLPNLMVNSLL
jgi:TolB-like protein